MATRMQQRRGTAAQWTSANPVLAAGEIGFEIDTNKFKMGDGIAQWADLSYFLDQEALGGSFDDYVPLTDKGAADGVATLDSNGKIPVAQLGNIVDGAPELLNTLNEIANALGDDPDFIGSVTSDLTDLATGVSQNANQLSELSSDLGAASALLATVDTRSQGHGTAITALETSVSTLNTDIGNVETSVSNLSTSVNTSLQTIQSDVADLTSDLSALSDDVTNNFTTLSTNLDTHATDTTNVHGIADTSVLVTTSQLDLKQDKVTGVSDTEIGYLDGVTSAIQTQLNGKASSTHTHAVSDVTGLQTALDGKASLSGATFTGSVEIDQNLVVDGNLTVNGTTFNASSTSIVIEDNMVQLAHQNAGNTVDLGMVVAYNDGAAKHAGIVRDVSDDRWKLFKGVTTEPTTTVNFAQGSLDDLALDHAIVNGVIFTDGEQTKQGVPSITPINQKTASYTTVLTDRDSLIEIGSSSATTLTIPSDASVNYPVGTSFDVLQTGSGQVTIAGAGGVTVNATPGLKLRTQWSSATIFKRAANTWVVYGDLSA